MKTQKEIVLETVEHYSDPNNRSLFYPSGEPKDATSVYVSTNGNKCAVGRCLKDVVANAIIPSRRIKGVARGMCKSTIDALFEPEYSGHLLDFWDKLQLLHDNHNHWSKNGITKEGIDFVNDNFNIQL
jgi:hypothetical protein